LTMTQGRSVHFRRGMLMSFHALITAPNFLGLLSKVPIDAVTIRYWRISTTTIWPVLILP